MAARISGPAGNHLFQADSQIRQCVQIKAMGSEAGSTQFIHSEKGFLGCHFDFRNKILLHLISSKLETRLVLWDGPQKIELAGRNYAELVSQPGFPRVADQIQDWGIKLPMQLDLSTMTELMLGIFRVRPEAWQEFQNDFNDLTANRFKDRELATQKLKSELNQPKYLVLWGLKRISATCSWQLLSNPTASLP